MRAQTSFGLTAAGYPLAVTIALILASLVWGGAALGQENAPASPPAHVGTPVCSGCHTEEAAAWKQSHHAKAWMLPGPDSVDGDFDNAQFTHKGRTSRFFEAEGAYFVETEDVPGEPQTYKVVGVGGIAPLQQYLVETEPGRFQSLDIVWDQEQRRWYHLYGEEAPPPDDGLHWSGPYKTWNSRCAECHATGFEKNHDLRTRSYSSRQSETGVGCEACHGPGEAHLAWAANPQTYEASPFPGTGARGLVIGFEKDLPETEIQQCAGCHSRREAFQDGNPLPGTPYHDAYRLALLRPGLYHADGQILDEVYVYGSFLQSKMYSSGVRCSNCHEPHSGQMSAEGNAVCTQCHSPAGNAEFPMLTRKLYDDPSHHFHATGTPGAECKSCHMIERTYMGIDGRRDHSFRVPRPDLSAKLGTPNACTDCHKEKALSWAAGEIADRFPNAKHRPAHYGEVFAAARQQRGAHEEDLLAVADQRTFPGIVRATALELLQASAAPEVAGKAAPLIEDDDPLVRAAAVALQLHAPPSERLQRIAPALDDEFRSVRMAAARLLIGAPIAQLPKAAAEAAGRATREWQVSLANKTDFPETHLALGGMALSMRNQNAALAAFEEATRLDPQLIDGWIMQVRVRMAIGDLAGAQKALQKALLANPEDPSLSAYKTQLGR
ncbi:multiheme c-type cytochrome [Roseibium aggregatum]|uniref:Uncharacterized protein n=1 Tax=Roseibium aggregatum TaxID=187304 RepID=A0A939J4J5_9HYPH|nr:multiheme c-type cytochrome [Roseibium aggregatum]MBN9671250.1 hypothetical protein [Roseibium aggregatum]